MLDIEEEIELLKDPRNIQDAVFADSPDVLRDAFDHDPLVQFVVNAGPVVVPMIKEEIETNGMALSEITLACYVYILSHIDRRSAARVLVAFYPRALERSPGPFSIHFITRIVREDRNLPLNARHLYYSPSELQETLRSVRERR